MNRGMIWLWILASLALAVAASPFLARGDQQSRLAREQNAETLAKMTAAQRERVLRNYDDYRKLAKDNPAALQAAETMHAALEKDRRDGAGELSKIAADYNAWLKTIEPYQRDALFKEADPQKRVALMKQTIDKQRAAAARRAFRDFRPGGNDRSGPGPGPHWEFPTLDPRELAAIMSAIEQKALPRLTEEQRQEVRSLSGVNRYVRLLRLLSQFGTGVGPHPLTERPPPEFAAVANEIDQYVENSRVREFMRANSGRWWTPEERLAHLLSRTLFVEVTRSTQSPGSEKLEKFLLDQPTDLQNELLARDASEFQTDLRNIYADSLKRQGDPKIEDLKEIFFGDKGPPGWNGPGRFPPDHGDRHPDDRGDGRPPGDRGPMGRDGFAGPREGRGFGPPRRGGDDGESRPAPRDGNGQGPGSDPGPPRDNRKEPPPPPPPRKDGQPPRNDAAPAERPGAPQT